jgi:hypothetical protein
LGIKHHHTHSANPPTQQQPLPHHPQQQQDQDAVNQQQQQQQQDEGQGVVEYYLIQRPLPELDRLRSGRGLRLKGIVLPPGHIW